MKGVSCKLFEDLFVKNNWKCDEWLTYISRSENERHENKLCWVGGGVMNSYFNLGNPSTKKYDKSFLP